MPGLTENAEKTVLTEQETTMRRLVPLVLAGLLLAVPGCQKRCSSHSALISHVVIFNLADPAQAEDLIEACDGMLAGIESVGNYTCGRHIDTGRPVVLDDYDVALIVGFNSQADYSAYLDDPKHRAFLDAWSDQISDVRIYDIHDP